MQNEIENFWRGAWATRRALIYLLVVAIGIFVLAPHFIGIGRVIRIGARANSFYLLLALGAECARYLVGAGSTLVLARLFKRNLPYVPLVASFFAGAAANRTFSTGGVPGIVVRALFLTKQGLSAGAVAALFLIEDVAGAVVGGIVLLGGLTIYARELPDANNSWMGLAVMLVIALLLVGGVLLFCVRRRWVELGAHLFVSFVSRISARLFGRAIYDAPRLQNSLAEFYAGLHLARAKPMYALASFGMNVLRYLAAMIALYYSFYALGWTLAPLTLILLSTVFSLLTTLSAAPAEVAIMGAGFAIVAIYFGAPPDVSYVGLLLSRALSFWLPIPLGYIALWNLRREKFL